MKKIIVMVLAICLFLAGCAGAADNAAKAPVVKAGLGIVTSNTSSKAATADAPGTAQTDSYIASILVDENNKIQSVSLDCIQAKTPFDVTGALTGTLGDIKTKKELGDDYGMKVASPIGKEWFEQVAALEDWMVGKTVDEVVGMEVYAKDENHTSVPKDATLASSCTMDVGGFLAAIEEAASQAK